MTKDDPCGRQPAMRCILLASLQVRIDIELCPVPAADLHDSVSGHFPPDKNVDTIAEAIIETSSIGRLAT